MRGPGTRGGGRRRRPAIVVVLAAVAAASLHAANAADATPPGSAREDRSRVTSRPGGREPTATGRRPARRFSYTVGTLGAVRGDPATLLAAARDALEATRGWALDGRVRFRRDPRGPDLRILLAAPAAIARQDPVCSARWSCRVGDRVLVNAARWRRPPKAWPLSRSAYRLYIVNHEVGHWLGLDHARCPGPGRVAPVMLQQSKGTDGCDAHPWPLIRERRSLARILGIARPPSRSPAPRGQRRVPDGVWRGPATRPLLPPHVLGMVAAGLPGQSGTRPTR